MNRRNMSRNLYKLILNLENEVKLLKTKVNLLENQCDHLETLLRLKDKIPTRPFYPNPETPWYKEPTLEPPYKVTCKTEDDPFVKLMKDTFGI